MISLPRGRRRSSACSTVTCTAATCSSDRTAPWRCSTTGSPAVWTSLAGWRSCACSWGAPSTTPSSSWRALRDLGALPADTDLDAVIRDLGIDQPVKDPTAMAPEELLARDPRDHQAPPRLRGPLSQGAHALRQGPALPRRGSGHAGTRRRPVRRGHPHRRLLHRLATGNGSPPKSASIPASTASTSTACGPSWASLPTWSG